MARILENEFGRRNILLTTDDILTLVKEYQTITQNAKSYDEVRRLLNCRKIYVPEEIV